MILNEGWGGGGLLLINKKMLYDKQEIRVYLSRHQFYITFLYKKIEGSINLYDLENSSYLKNIVLVGRVENIMYM